MKGGYTFSSEPRAVQNGKSRGYRGHMPGQENQDYDANGKPKYKNIMHDHRVVRGNTYSSQIMTEMAQNEAERYRAEQEKENRRQAALRNRRSSGNNEAPRSPPPVPGRKHMDIQTDQYLEELGDRVVEKEIETQTESFMDRPTEPLFMPAVTGVDAETQVDVDELFDFDLEVEPILEVIVGKTLEHAMMEVLEEEELQAIRKHQMEFDRERNARLAEVQRLEGAEKRRQEEKLRRIKQEAERTARENDIKQKVAARAFAKDYLTGLHKTVFNNLQQAGHFTDPLEKEVTATFIPWIAKVSRQQFRDMDTARHLTNFLISETLTKYRDACEAAKEEARIRAEEEAARLLEEEEAQEEDVEMEEDE